MSSRSFRKRRERYRLTRSWKSSSTSTLTEKSLFISESSRLMTFQTTESNFDTKILLTYTDHDVEKTAEGIGNGPIDSVKRALQDSLDIDIKILDYSEHALQSGSNSQAAAYIHLLDANTGAVTYGVGVSSNITRASVRAIFSAMNRLGLGEQ